MSERTDSNSDDEATITISAETPSKPSKLKLTKSRKSQPVDIEQEDGTTKEYILREMSGKERDKWLNTNTNRFQIDRNTGVALGMKDHTDFQAGLISKCLYDGTTLVPLTEISSWPATALYALFEACQELNGMTDKAATESKS